MLPSFPNRKTLPAAMLAALLLTASLPAVADDGPGSAPPGEFGHGGHHDRHGGGPFMHALKDLDLSDSQRETIRGDVEAAHEDGRARFEALRSVHRAFETTVPGSAGYGTVVAQMADAAAAGARDRVQKAAALRAQIYALLTDAQKAKLASALASLPEPPARR
ncbi:MAG: hypothetical protein NVS9B10_16640 [Nevskia sp.]